MNIIQKYCVPSNYSKGRDGYRIRAIVIHIAEGSLEGTDQWFASSRPLNPTSAHYCVGKNGEIHQYVQDEDIAFHAGIVKNPTCAKWITAQNPNRITLGIENEGFSGKRWTIPQMEALRALVTAKCLKYSIPQDKMHIIGHSEIADYKEDMSKWIEELLNPYPPTRNSLLARIKELSLVLLKLLQGKK